MKSNYQLGPDIYQKLLDLWHKGDTSQFKACVSNLDMMQREILENLWKQEIASK